MDGSLRTWVRLSAVGLFGTLLLVFAGSAAAGPLVGKDGKVHACYAVSGKAKGRLRLVSKKKHCKHRERKLSWSTGTTTAPGPAGSQGAVGPQGATGEPGPRGPAAEAPSAGGLASKAEVAAMTRRIEELEETLAGLDDPHLTEALASIPAIDSSLTGLGSSVQQLEATLAGTTHDELSGALSKLDGISGAELNEAVRSVPTVTSTALRLAGAEELLAGVGKGDLEGALVSLPRLEDTVTGTTAEISTLDSRVAGLGGTLEGLSNAELTEAVQALPSAASLAPRVARVEGLVEGVGSGDLAALLTALPELEGTVSGLGSNVGDLTGILGGLTNSQLVEAVAAAPEVSSLCAQTSTLTSQDNLISSALGRIKVIGGLLELEVPQVPALQPFSC